MTVGAAFALAARRAPLAAQVSPNADWHSLETRHFYIHFTPPLEPLARRIAGDAERAYTELSRELHPPRGMIDVVISDDVDASNGSATPYPTNRIIVYANPPVDESALRYTNDWGQLVITHELTHIFHLDRTRGLWAVGQHVFGRADALFPNMYAPSWLVEGLAVYEESKLTGAGRIEGSEHRMIARAAAVDHAFPAIGALSLAQGHYPFGEYAYGYGSLFVDYLARSRGEQHVRDFVEKESADIIPYFIDVPAKQGFGVSFTRAWREFADSVTRTIGPQRPPVPDWRDLTRDGVFVYTPRWLGDTAIVYSGAPGRESFGAYRVNLDGKRTRIGRRNSRSANVPLGNGQFLYSQIDFVNPYQQRADLWVQRGRHEHRLTFGQRLTNPDVRADGLIVSEQIVPGATRLVLVSRDGKRVTPITTGTYDEQWTEPRWSHSGTYIAASRWLRGNISQVVVVDTTGRVVHVVSSGASIEATPSWLAGDNGILYSSDRTGSAQVYEEQFAGPLDFRTPTTIRVSNAVTGLFEPTQAPTTSRVAAVVFRSDGYHLGVAGCCSRVDVPVSAGTAASGGQEVVAPLLDTVPRRPIDAVVVDSGPVLPYSPWRTFWPRYWLPKLDQGTKSGYRVGLTTSGFDVVGRHAMTADLEIPTDNTGIVGDLSYQYSGFGLPIIQADVSQDYEWLGSIYARDASRTVLGDVFRRERTADLLATWLRQRYRTASSVTGGFALEHRSHSTDAPVSLSSVDSVGALGTTTFPTFIAGVGFANYQRPPFSISPEDGISFNTTFRDRFNSGAAGHGGASYSTVAQLSLYKSLDFPGFAHHVIALRGSAGIADERAAGYYAVGGISGSTLQIIPGYTIGEGHNTFPVRGFAQRTLV
ncbi:MAG TPA: hypothetical protein VH277_18440, partial [Gemmatimonadaceae bacterium]|nr:hypothetical protein [Gemmatimonadaceae bacterium]